MASRDFPQPSTRLGYLLKHAFARMDELNADALRPLEITSRDVGVLLTIATGEPPSQQEAATRLGLDRTTMVALLDGLEGKHLVARKPSPGDRRRNVVTLSGEGEKRLREALELSDGAEAEFLAALDPAAAADLRAALQAALGMEHPNALVDRGRPAGASPERG